MKNLKLITLIIIAIIIVSCGEKNPQETFTPVETEQIFAFPLDTPFHSNRTLGYYHAVVDGETLDGIARKYLLNDRTRWGEFLVLNPYLGNDADARSYRVPTGPAYTIFPGEIIMLPNNAVGAQSMGASNSTTFELGEDIAEEYVRSVPTEQDNSKLFTKSDPKIVQKPIKNDSTFLGNMSWFPNLLPLLWYLLVAGLVIYLLYSFWRDRKNRTSVTESHTYVCTGNCSNNYCGSCELKIMTDSALELSKGKGNFEMNYENANNTKMSIKYTNS